MTKAMSSLWSELSPAWMFRCKPSDFTSFARSICPGVFWMPGMVWLFLLHAWPFMLFLSHLWEEGYRPAPLYYLSPVLLSWIVFFSADIKFRLQKPTRQERDAFDNTVVNWCGLIGTLLCYLVGIPYLLFIFLWHLLT